MVEEKKEWSKDIEEGMEDIVILPWRSLQSTWRDLHVYVWSSEDL